MKFSKHIFDAIRKDEAVKAEKEAVNKEWLKKHKAGKEGRAVYLNRVDIKRIRVKN